MTKRRFKTASRMIAKRVLTHLAPRLSEPYFPTAQAKREKELEAIVLEVLMQLENQPLRD
jgi:hypothetical protein